MKRQEETVFSVSQLMKFGLSLLGAFCLLTGPARAQESETLEDVMTGTGYFVQEWNPTTYAADPVASIHGTSEGVSNVLGRFSCSWAGSNRYLGVAESLPAHTECDAESQLTTGSYQLELSFSECRLEDTGQILTSALSREKPGASCIPRSCLVTREGEVPLIRVGCPYTAFSTGTWVSQDGTVTSEGESVQTITIQSVEGDATSAVGRYAYTETVMVTLALKPEAELPANDIALEVPGKGSTMSGIGIISGWSCLGGQLEAEFSEADGEVIATVPLAHGISRGDTESKCGDSDNGFSATMNWALLGPGERTIRLIQNGEVLASHAFSVVAFEEEFITGEWMTTVDEFPTAGQSATLEWDESQQQFVVTEIN